MRPFFRSSTAILTATAIASAPGAGGFGVVRAQDTATSAEQALATLLQSIGNENALLQRLEAVEADIAALRSQAEADARTIARLTEEVSAAEASVVALSQALDVVGALGERTADLVNDATETFEEVRTSIPDELQALIDQALGQIEPGDWIEGLEEDEILQRMQEMRGLTEQINQFYLQQRRNLNDRLRDACDDVPVPQTLAPYLSDAVPRSWTADVARIAVEAEVELPDCFNTPTTGDPDGPTLNDDLQEYMASQQASQQMAMAMNSMMMVAMSSGNPYIIAAALVIMALMAIFGDDGSGGGDGDGEGPGDGDAGGDDNADGNGEGNEGTATGQAGQNGDDAGADPDPQAEPVADPAGGGTDEVVPVEQATALPPGFENVAEGIDTHVYVLGQTISFTDLATGEVWDANWPPVVPDTGGVLPDFTPDVRIESASVPDRTFTVTMTLGECEAPRTIEIGADQDQEPNRPGGLIVLSAPGGLCQ